jgi:hypothetical protein
MVLCIQVSQGTAQQGVGDKAHTGAGNLAYRLRTQIMNPAPGISLIVATLELSSTGRLCRHRNAPGQGAEAVVRHCAAVKAISDK